MSQKNIVTWTAMLVVYAKNGQIINARKLFDKMPERTTATYNAMISGYILKARKFHLAEELYREVPCEFRDPVCSNALMNGYLKIGETNEALRVFENVGESKRDVVSWSAVVVGLCRDGRIGYARKLFDRMPERNVVSWSAMIDGYMEKGLFENGFGFFLEMRREGVVEVNSTTMTIMIKGCGNCGGVKDGMQIHGLVSRLGFEFVDAAYEVFERMPEKDLISWTAMIRRFVTDGRMGKPVELFDTLKEKDDFVWTVLISGFVSNEEYEEALCWYVRMNREGCKPNPLTISSVLAASASLVALNEGLQIHSHVLKMNLEYDLSIQNSLISFYAKCGNVTDAYKIFVDVVELNVVSNNSVINGFTQNGFGEEALNMYKRMQNESLEPNRVTFLAVLSACTHAGLIEEGRNLFDTMKSRYRNEPDADHYACMVDLLGRAGLLDEANDLIRSITVKPHSGVWGALLAASSAHLRLDLAKLAAQHITKLEPANATPYVVLSNLYSAAGQKIEGDLGINHT
ncbi:PPR containing plant-like protein [Medicago truncatula]|uniref:PPR containing plant-like protein n=1 Tax=Medicago truncatula TaxID=3880 RepID=A0A072VAM8_MEDTR|nr:PPR containing plant-like protein [Medicago truncatula]